MSSWGAAMRTSRKKSSTAGGVDSEAVRQCRRTPTAMEDGSGATSGCALGHSVLHSPSLRSLVGEECLQLLKCSICTEFFNIPIVLPCGHTFCLQCLIEMCKVATRPDGQNPGLTGTEALIGCPTCHVQIFAAPILQRNVTCNFIIQTLVDTLRNRIIPGRVNVSVNTDRSLVPPVRAISEEALCGVLRDLNRLSASLRHRSVLDDAFFEIEHIRSCHLANPNRCTDTPAPVDDMPASSLALAPDSLTTAFAQQQKNSLETPKRCYAAAVVSGRDRLSAESVLPTTTAKSTDVVFRGTRPQFGCQQSPLVPSHASAFHVPSLPQLGRSLSPGFQNRNRNNPRAVFHTSSKLKRTVTASKLPAPVIYLSPVLGQAHPFSTSRSVRESQPGCGQKWESLHQLARSAMVSLYKAHVAGTDLFAVKVREGQGQMYIF